MIARKHLMNALCLFNVFVGKMAVYLFSVLFTWRDSFLVTCDFWQRFTSQIPWEPKTQDDIIYIVRI